MKIGLFTDTYRPDINGVANSTAILFDELKKHGHEVYVIAPRKGVVNEWNEDHDILRLGGIELKQLYGYILTSPVHLTALNEIRKLDLDIIHAQTEFGVGIFARICASTLGIPLVSTYHTTYEDYTHYVNIIHSNLVDTYAKKAVAHLSKLYGDSSLRVISPSYKTKVLLEKYNLNSGIRVIPTGLPLDKFSLEHEDLSKSKHIRNEYHISDDELMICYVGRIAKEKALDLVIEGFSLLPASSKSKLVIIGKGPDEKHLADLIEKYSARNRIVLAGPKPSDEVPDYYRAADAFISASLSETQGMTFIEALASGLPLFAREDDVLKDILVPEETGWFFKDQKDLVNKILHFESLSKEERQSMEQYCLKYVQKYSSEAFYESVLQVYQESIDEYNNQYTVEDVKVVKDYVQLILKNHLGEKRLIISMDDYYNQGIRKGEKLSTAQVETIQKNEERVRAYQGCLRRIASKDRTVKEMRDWLTSKTTCDEETVEEILQSLKDKSLLNDDKYCENYISSMRVSLFGKNRIHNGLKKKGISEEMIQAHLDKQPDDLEQVRTYAMKIHHTLGDESVRMTKRKIKTKLLQRGYSLEDVDTVINELDYKKDELNERNNLVRCALKARKRYEKKYTGTQLRNAIYRYCASQGYNSEEIYVILDEMEWDDD